MADGLKMGSSQVLLLLIVLMVFPIPVLIYTADLGGSSEVWAITLSEDGRYLAGTTHDGHIKVWDLDANGEQIRDFETKGSFGTSIDLVIFNAILIFLHMLILPSLVCRWPIHSEWPRKWQYLHVQY